MSDIDFDELDKAVNSLVGKVPSDDDTPKAKTLDINSTLGPGEKPAYDKLSEVAKTIGNETLVAAGERTVVEDLSPAVAKEKQVTEPAPSRSVPVAPRPTSGRFMDVMHSSSNMKTADENKPAPVVSEPVVVEPAAPKPEPIPAPKPEPVPDLAPLTPFLPDAKVEKRPLGGASSPPSDDTSSSETAEEVLEKAPEPNETTAVNMEGWTSHDPANDNQAVLNAANFKTEESSESIPKDLQAIESGDTEMLKAASEGRQPNEATETSVQTSGAIYDVNNSPKPLGHPAKQKSGWGVVVIILVIIVLSAVLGAAAYFIFGLGL